MEAEILKIIEELENNRNKEKTKNTKIKDKVKKLQDEVEETKKQLDSSLSELEVSEQLLNNIETNIKSYKETIRLLDEININNGMLEKIYALLDSYKRDDAYDSFAPSIEYFQNKIRESISKIPSAIIKAIDPKHELKVETWASWKQKNNMMPTEESIIDKTQELLSLEDLSKVTRIPDNEDMKEKDEILSSPTKTAEEPLSTFDDYDVSDIIDYIDDIKRQEESAEKNAEAKEQSSQPTDEEEVVYEALASTTTLPRTHHKIKSLEQASEETLKQAKEKTAKWLQANNKFEEIEQLMDIPSKLPSEEIEILGRGAR